MLLRNLLGSPATTERTRARGEKTSGQEREGVGAVQSLALVRVREEAGLSRRARGGLDPCETDLHDSGGLRHARHRKHWAWPDDIDSDLSELAHGRRSNEQSEAAAGGHLNAPRSQD